MPIEQKQIRDYAKSLTGLKDHWTLAKGQQSRNVGKTHIDLGQRAVHQLEIGHREHRNRGSAPTSWEPHVNAGHGVHWTIIPSQHHLIRQATLNGHCLLGIDIPIVADVRVHRTTSPGALA